MDLKLKFLRQDITDALGSYVDGDEIELTLTGELQDGTPFSLTDCIWIIDKAKEGLATAGTELLSNPAAKDNEEVSSWGTIKALYR